MKVRKRDIVAFQIASEWRIGTVNAATRTGKVKEILCNGGIFKMDARGQRVTEVLAIPSDRVERNALLDDAIYFIWPTLAECEAFVSEYLV